MADETKKNEQSEQTPQNESTPTEATEQEVVVIDDAVAPAPEDDTVEDSTQEPTGDTAPEEGEKTGKDGIAHNPNALDPDLPTPYGEEVVSVLEALLFATTQPLNVTKISVLMNGVPEEEIEEGLKVLHTRYLGNTSGLILMEIANGWQIATRPEVADWILRLHKHRKRQTLSPSLLETLAIVAYKQPLTRAEIEAIRGVDCGSAMRSIQDAGLAEVVGRKETLGRPPLYGTTELFLKTFGLKEIEQLPSLGDLKSILNVQMKAPPVEEDELEETIEGEESKPEAETETATETVEVKVDEAPMEEPVEEQSSESEEAAEVSEEPESDEEPEESDGSEKSDTSDESNDIEDPDIVEADAPTHDHPVEADMTTEDAALEEEDDEEDDEKD